MLRSIDRGCDRLIRVEVWQNGALADLTGATPNAYLRRGDPVLTWGSAEGNQPIAISADKHSVELRFVPTATQTINTGKYQLDVWVTLAGKKYRVLSEQIYVKE
jgi:hypothetical protein